MSRQITPREFFDKFFSEEIILSEAQIKMFELFDVPESEKKKMVFISTTFRRNSPNIKYENRIHNNS